MPVVVLVSCHLCGREFGTASIRLHHPHCTRSVKIISIDWSLHIDTDAGLRSRGGWGRESAGRCPPRPPFSLPSWPAPRHTNS